MSTGIDSAYYRVLRDFFSVSGQFLDDLNACKSDSIHQFALRLLEASNLAQTEVHRIDALVSKGEKLKKE